MVLAVPTDAESAGLYSGETETNGLSESSGIDVRDPILVTYASVRVV